MKPQYLRPARLNPIVAPRAGAWIETLKVHLDASSPKVAPRAGAWIETLGRVLRL